jgi:hypothetical protein
MSTDQTGAWISDGATVLAAVVSLIPGASIATVPLTELAKYGPDIAQIVADWTSKGAVTIQDVLDLRQDAIMQANVDKDTVQG